MGNRDARFGTRPPRFDRPIDLEAHIAKLPPGATAKGMFLRDPIQYAQATRPGADVLARAGISRHRILPFFDYPYPELMRVLVAAAETCWPGEPVGEGLRRLGRRAYGALTSAQIGRVIFAAFGNDFSRVAAVGPRGWKVGLNFGHVRYEALGEGHGVFHVREMPAFLETYQVGVVEGAMQFCSVAGEVWVRLDGFGDGAIEMWWD